MEADNDEFYSIFQRDISPRFGLVTLGIRNGASHWTPDEAQLALKTYGPTTTCNIILEGVMWIMWHPQSRKILWVSSLGNQLSHGFRTVIDDLFNLKSFWLRVLQRAWKNRWSLESPAMSRFLFRRDTGQIALIALAGEVVVVVVVVVSTSAKSEPVVLTVLFTSGWKFPSSQCDELLG